MWEPEAPTYFHTHTHTHILCITSKFLMKNKVYHYITDWMILIGLLLLIGLIERKHIFTSQMVVYPIGMYREMCPRVQELI